MLLWPPWILEMKVICKLNLVICGWGIYWAITLRWMSLGLTDDEWTLVQSMAINRTNGLLPNMYNCGLRMLRECRERFPRHRRLAIPTCITTRASRMHNPQFYVSGKRPMLTSIYVTITCDVTKPQWVTLWQFGLISLIGFTSYMVDAIISRNFRQSAHCWTNSLRTSLIFVSWLFAYFAVTAAQIDIQINFPSDRLIHFGQIVLRLVASYQY